MCHCLGHSVKAGSLVWPGVVVTLAAAIVHGVKSRTGVGVDEQVLGHTSAT